MKRLVTFLVILFWLIKILSAQSSTGYVFVVKIAPSYNGVVTYYEAFFDGRRFSETEPLSKQQFVRRVVGKERSLANPDTLDLCDKYGIKNRCKVDVFGNAARYGILDSLWKLRYAVYPYHVESSDTLGWTGNIKNPYVPTHAQKRILAQMGMDTTFYTIFGDNLFRLLKAMEDPQWIANYKNARDDNQTSPAEDRPVDQDLRR